MNSEHIGSQVEASAGKPIVEPRNLTSAEQFMTKTVGPIVQKGLQTAMRRGWEGFASTMMQHREAHIASSEKLTDVKPIHSFPEAVNKISQRVLRREAAVIQSIPLQNVIVNSFKGFVGGFAEGVAEKTHEELKMKVSQIVSRRPAGKNL